MKIGFGHSKEQNRHCRELGKLCWITNLKSPGRTWKENTKEIKHQGEKVYIYMQKRKCIHSKIYSCLWSRNENTLSERSLNEDTLRWSLKTLKNGAGIKKKNGSYRVWKCLLCYRLHYCLCKNPCKNILRYFLSVDRFLLKYTYVDRES